LVFDLVFWENSSGIPDDLALVLSKELDRAAKRAAKTIDAASAAVSVTSLFSKSVHGGGGGGGGKKKKTERQVKHGQGKEVEVVKDAVKARKVEERQVKEVVEVAEEKVEERKLEEVEEVKSFIM
jgi:hypothetical protein